MWATRRVRGNGRRSGRGRSADVGHPAAVVASEILADPCPYHSAGTLVTGASGTSKDFS